MQQARIREPRKGRRPVAVQKVPAWGRRAVSICQLLEVRSCFMSQNCSITRGSHPAPYATRAVRCGGHHRSWQLLSGASGAGLHKTLALTRGFEHVWGQLHGSASVSCPRHLSRLALIILQVWVSNSTLLSAWHLRSLDAWTKV